MFRVPQLLAPDHGTVSTWVAAVYPDADTVRVGLPVVEGRYRKLAELAPFEIVTVVIVEVSAVLRNTPLPAGLVAKLTVNAPDVNTVPSRA